MVTTLEQAILICNEYGYDFWEKVVEYAISGHVIITPDAICLASEHEYPDVGRGIFVWLALPSGALAKLLPLVPDDINWIQWGRGLKGQTVVKTYPFKRVKRLILHFNGVNGRN